MVVAFTTIHSKHDLQLLNRHAFSGFTEVERGSITVAVAKQVKGGHTKTAAVKHAIDKCMPQQVEICLNVIEKLGECQENIFGKRLSQTFTAVHAYKKKSQTATSGVEAPNENDFAIPQSASLTPHLYTGKCGKSLGKFMVLIKSDKELLRKEDLCSSVNCGEKGKCVVVPETFITMCECQYPYYGERCDTSLESYRRSRKSTPKSSADRRSQKSKSQSSADRRSRKSTPERSAQGRDYKLFCGSQCEDVD